VSLDLGVSWAEKWLFLLMSCSSSSCMRERKSEPLGLPLGSPNPDSLFPGSSVRTGQRSFSLSQRGDKMVGRAVHQPRLSDVLGRWLGVDCVRPKRLGGFFASRLWQEIIFLSDDLSSWIFRRRRLGVQDLFDPDFAFGDGCFFSGQARFFLCYFFWRSLQREESLGPVERSARLWKRIWISVLAQTGLPLDRGRGRGGVLRRLWVSRRNPR
jgi:hypothetical protein